MRSQPPDLPPSTAVDKLQAIGQEHLLRHWGSCTPPQKKALVQQISLLDAVLFRKQQRSLFQPCTRQFTHVPFTTSFQEGSLVLEEQGKALVGQGKVGVVILAGGQGSRLRFAGPKGCVPITPFREKSLFQLIAEKIAAASAQAELPLPVAVMTSPLNDHATRAFFEEHAFFGLLPSQVSFFSQHMWPLLDLEGNLFLQDSASIAEGPNGNGSLFYSLAQSGILDRWDHQCVEHVRVMPVDNPLAAPFAFELLGLHCSQGADVSLQTGARMHPDENVGVLARISHHLTGGRAVILEYTELTSEERYAQDEHGKLSYALANLGLYVFSLSFLRQVSHTPLPLHAAKKAVPRWGQEEHLPNTPNCWKCEEYLFDVLPLAGKVEALLCDRKMCFAPLKNFNGADSIGTVREALIEQDRIVYASVSGIEVSEDTCFELSPRFYYPSERMLRDWKGRPLPDRTYIEAEISL